ncbi:hypothetical protein BGZ63DRAFT_408107 [Mariannaea sp. PMI_226]|nr:hypothetical protein BGZ63DRAFT_408107 [Mariannaea sp. PMI_226]
MFKESIKGPGMIILQVLRVFTIIALLAAAVACWTLIIKIDTSSGWFFFDAASLFFTSTIATFIVVSELPFAKGYFRRNWPVLSDECGLTWLGVAMCIIGCNILGKLNQPSNTSKELGMPFWRLVLAAGVLAITFGICNIVCSFIFRDSANGISARAVRSEGSLATAHPTAPSLKEHYSVRSNSFKEEKGKSSFMSFFWGKNKKNKNISSPRPEISAPMPSHVHHQYDVERDPAYSPSFQQTTDGEQWDHDRRSPIAPDIRRPDTALHPMNHAVSRYSEAHMSRF